MGVARLRSKKLTEEMTGSYWEPKETRNKMKTKKTETEHYEKQT